MRKMETSLAKLSQETKFVLGMYLVKLLFSFLSKVLVKHIFCDTSLKGCTLLTKH